MTTARPLRRGESQERTRLLLLEAARPLFEQGGYRSTSLADVAAAAGFSKGAVYSNFASKEHLFLATVEDEYGTQLAVLHEELARGEDIPARLGILGAWFAANITGHPLRARAIAEFALATDADTEVRARLADLRRRLSEVVARLLQEQQEQLGLRFQLPPTELAEVVLALVDGLVIQDTFTPAPSTRFPAAMRLLLARAREDED